VEFVAVFRNLRVPILCADIAFFAADSYAEYATWKYFEALFGTPDAVVVPREEED
jgi:hypothetical protein